MTKLNFLNHIRMHDKHDCKEDVRKLSNVYTVLLMRNEGHE